MCLDTRFKPEVEKKMITALPDGLITVFRWVEIKNTGGYKALWTEYSFYAGLNRATYSRLGGQKKLNGLYKAGFHSYRSKLSAKRAGPNKSACCVVLIRAQIRKEWIGAIGKSGRCIVYVTDRIISPSSRDKSAIVE